MNTKLHRACALLETIFIENHPDHRASGMGPVAMLYWGLRMGLISQAEKDEIMGFSGEQQ